MTAAAVAAAAIGLSLGAWAFARATERALVDRLDSDLTADAAALAAGSGDVGTVRRLVAATPPERVAQVRRSDGTVLAASPHAVRQSADLSELDVVSDPDTAQLDEASPWLSGTDDLRLLGAGWHVVAATDDGREAIVAAPLADLRAAVGTVSGLAAVSIPLLTGLTGLLVWFVLGRVLRPVEVARRRAAEAVSVYPPPRLEPAGGGTEVDALLTTLDDLLGRAAQSQRRQRRFFADAAHELMSPLASLRTNLQVAQRSSDPAAMARSLERCLSSEARLEALAHQLLALARHEQLGPPPDHDVDLSAIVTEIAADVAAEDAGERCTVAIGVDLEAELAVVGDPIGLHQAIDNLVRNAARHASAHLSVTSEATADSVTLLVDDDGPGIPSAQRSTVFEPFVRLDEARDRQRGGAGLGLAIVRSVVARHGGEVQVEDGPMGGARVRLTLPTRATSLSDGAGQGPPTRG